MDNKLSNLSAFVSIQKLDETAKAAPTGITKNKREDGAPMDRMDIEDDLESKIQAFSIPVGSFANSDKKLSSRQKGVEVRVCKDGLDSHKKRTVKQTLKGGNVLHQSPEKGKESKLQARKRSTGPKTFDKEAKSPDIPEGKKIGIRSSVRISAKIKTSMRGKRKFKKETENVRESDGKKYVKKFRTGVEKEKSDKRASKHEDENDLSLPGKYVTEESEEKPAKRRRKDSQKSKEAKESLRLNTRQGKGNFKKKEGEDQGRLSVDKKEIQKNQESNGSPSKKSQRVKPDLTKDTHNSGKTLKPSKIISSPKLNISMKTRPDKTEISLTNSVMKSSSSGTGSGKKKVSLREDFEVINNDHELESSQKKVQRYSAEHNNNRNYLKTSQLSMHKKSARQPTVEDKVPSTLSTKWDEKEALAENLHNATPLFRDFYNKAHNVKLPNKMWSMHKDPRGAFVSFIHISGKSGATNLVIGKAVTFRQNTVPIVYIHGMKVNMRGSNNEISSCDMLRQLLYRLDGFVPCDGVKSRSGSGRSEKCELYAERCFLKKYVCKHCDHEQKFLNLREDLEGVDFLP